MKTWFRETLLFRSFQVYEKKARHRLFGSILIQSCLAILDLLGIAAIGLIGAMSVRGIQSNGNSKSIDKVLRILNLEQLTFQLQVAILAILATTILITKTLISIVAIRRIYRFMSNQSAILSTDLLERILKQPLSFISTLTPNKILYSVTAGCSRITLGITGNYVSLISDGVLLVLLFSALLFVDLTLTLSIGMFFSIAIIIFHQLRKRKAEEVGEIESTLNIESNRLVLEGIETYRERYVKNTLPSLAKHFYGVRIELSRALAESAFLPNVTKYVIESLVLVGALLICAIQFAVNDAGQAIATLSIFIGAATRVTPAIMRMQQSLIQIRNSGGAARTALELIENLRQIAPSQEDKEKLESASNHLQVLLMRDVSYSYPGSEHVAVNKVNIELRHGESIALVGPSGGGKSTIADLMLGITEPDSGSVEVFSQSPRKLISQNQGKIGYVPQLTTLLSDTLRENLLLGLDLPFTSDSFLISLLEAVGLKGEFEHLDINLNTVLGESGINLSGGQLQRLGIARALVTKPLFIILDEATSSLDATSENTIINTLNKLQGQISTVIIAHRLSTIRDVDRIYYIENGEVVSSGNFDELRKNVDDFNTQANLMGL